MVIHTKEKPKLKIKGAPETKTRGRTILTVRNGPRIAGTAAEKSVEANGKIKLGKGSVYAAGRRKTGRPDRPAEKAEYGSENGAARGRKPAGSTQDRKAGTDTWGVQENGQEPRQSVDHGNSMYARYSRTKAEKEAAVKKKSPVPAAVVSVAAKSALDEMDGGSEVYEAYMAARALAKPAANAADAGRNLYRLRAAKAKEQRIKKRRPGGRIRGKAIKESAAEAAKETVWEAAKEKAKEAGKEAVKEASKETAKGAGRKAAKETSDTAAKAGAAAGGVLAGALADEAAGMAMDRRDVRNATRNRMISLFVAKLKQEGNQDSIGKALKDIALMRFSIMAKYIVRYVGLFLLTLFAAVAVIMLPVIVVIAVIYNSPFAVFFPSISSAETAQEVLSAYVAEFNREVDEQVKNHDGYDTSEKIYVNFEGSGTPDNFCDILMVYMVKYGDGDTATDMTDTAKRNLKTVFDDMRSYTITGRTDRDGGGEGNTSSMTVKEVKVELKSCYDMVSVYGFNAEEQEVLAGLMKPEYLAMLGYTGGGGDPGEGVSPEQYQAVVDAISDENGRQAVTFALSKVGYPYSQAYRDSGNYYDCSSLAYYAWRSAGVNIMYEGSNTAASEGKFCYDNSLLVSYDEMRPGDLIFYSYGRNGQFMDITHVAIYAGDGKAVEAANTRLGVVYRPVQGRSSIVFIGRPR